MLTSISCLSILSESNILFLFNRKFIVLVFQRGEKERERFSAQVYHVFLGQCFQGEDPQRTCV